MKLITPICSAKYIWLFRPNEKFGSVYSVSCITEDTSEWKNLYKQIEEKLEEYYQAKQTLAGKRKLKRCPYMPWRLDSDDATQLFVCKNNSEGKKKDGTTFKTHPTIYGPDMKPLDETNLKGSLGTGTKLRCGFTVNFWENDAQGIGVSARLNWAQIIEPKYYSGVEEFGDVNALKVDCDSTLFNFGATPKKDTADEDEALTEDDFINRVSKELMSLAKAR